MEESDVKPEPPGEPIGKTVYLAGGEVDQTSVSLRFCGDDLDLDIYYVENRLIPVDPSALDAQSKGFPD